MKKKSIITLTFVIIAVGGVLLYPKIFPSESERKVLYWTDPMMPGFKSDKPGKSPMGMEMVPMYDPGNAGGGTIPAQGNQQNQIEYYTCPMHPQVRQDKPGNCSICSMKLIPVTKNPAKAATTNQAAPESAATIFVSPEKQQL